MNGEVDMNAKVTRVFAAFFLTLATFGVGGSDLLQGIPGIYKLVEVNGNKLPAVSWVGPGGECKQEILSATMLVDSESSWAVLVEEREVCASNSEESTSEVGFAIFTGSYKVAGNKIEFHDETLGVTDYASLENDTLQYTVVGVGDYESQTGVYIFRRAK